MPAMLIIVLSVEQLKDWSRFMNNLAENTKKQYMDDIDLLAFWATCFDYKKFTPDVADNCVEAEQRLMQLIDKLDFSINGE